MTVAVECSDLVFELASGEDDADLRQLLRENPMPGEISVSLEREPDFFLAASLEGEVHHTIVARDARSGRIVGMASHSVREAFVNGQPRRIGYLSQLRIDRAYRGSTRILVGGHAACRKLRGPEGLPYDLTSIVESNTTARRLLEAGLPGLPRYQCFEPFVTSFLPAKRVKKRRSDVEIVRGSPARLADIVHCLQRNYARFQFAPVWKQDTLTCPARARGLRLMDLYLAVRHGRVIGCLAKWDQAAFKQVVIRGYGQRLARWRPLLNRIGPLIGMPRLPAVGTAIHHAYLSHVAVDGDDPEAFFHLLTSALGDAARVGYTFLAVGLAERHPLLKVVRRLGCRLEYRSLLYMVYWSDETGAVPMLDPSRVPHVEVATL